MLPIGTRLLNQTNRFNVSITEIRAQWCKLNLPRCQLGMKVKYFMIFSFFLSFLVNCSAASQTNSSSSVGTDNACLEQPGKTMGMAEYRIWHLLKLELPSRPLQAEGENQEENIEYHILLLPLSLLTLY